MGIVKYFKNLFLTTDTKHNNQFSDFVSLLMFHSFWMLTLKVSRESLSRFTPKGFFFSSHHHGWIQS